MAEPSRVVNAYREFGFRLRPEVVNVNRLSIDNCSTPNGAADKGLFKTKPRLNRAIVSCQPEYIFLNESNHRVIRTAYASGALCNCIQHRLDIGWRASNHTQNLARR